MDFERNARFLEAAVSTVASRRAATIGHIELFDAVVTNSLLASASRDLFADGHYDQAIEQGFKAVNTVVQQRTGFADEWRPLMERAFSPKDPKLAVNDLKSRADKDEQTGAMMLFGGAMAGIRNVRAHKLHRTDDATTALELLAFANYLIRVAESASIRN